MADKFFYARNGLQVAPNTRLIVPVGNTAQRPGVPQNGDFRYNIDTGVYEGYYTSNTSWAAIGTTTIPTDPIFNTVTVGNSTVNSFSNSTGLQFQSSAGVFSIVNTTAHIVSNTTTSAQIGPGLFQAGANVVVNTSAIGLGNSTVSLIANSTSLTLGLVVANTSALKVGNSTVFVTANATTFSGTSNNASNLGGVAAGSYALTSALSAYQTTAGLSAAVSVLTANNTSYLGGIAAGNFWRTDTLVYLSQLNNNVGYITTLSSSGSYSCQYMTAGGYLYSSGNIYAVGDVLAAYSDLRLKNLQGSIFNPLDKVDSLQAFYYTRNSVAPELGNVDEKVKVGLIAQDVQQVMPEAVGLVKNAEGNDTEYMTVQYERLVPLLVEAIKELRREVNALKGI